MAELLTDPKRDASFTLGNIIVQTRENFPDERYQPKVLAERGQYHIYTINPYPYEVWNTADGVGTKPELAERLYTKTGDSRYFEGLPFDLAAMTESDEARFGRIFLGFSNIIDINEADPQVIAALAKGLLAACTQGKFALINGETAELGYRTTGWGKTRVNLNAVGTSLIVPEKLILGTDLTPGQPIVALKETGIRSNGLTKARTILEAAYLHKLGFTSKKEYLLDNLSEFLRKTPGININRLASMPNILPFLSDLIGHDFEEQVLLPWHNEFPEIVEQLLEPSKLYGPVINEAQGWVNGPKQVDIIAAAHISGGGIPEKVRRMVSQKRLGARIEAVFPDPEGVKSLLDLANNLPEEQRDRLISQRTASQQWNRGIGFVVVTQDLAHANRLIEIADELGYEAAVAGEILKEPKIEWRGETWTY